MRIIFLGLDHMRTDASPFVTDNDGKPIPRNPLKDVRVRRALSLAIDRQAIVDRVMEGAAIPTNQFMLAYPTRRMERSSSFSQSMQVWCYADRRAFVR